MQCKAQWTKASVYKGKDLSESHVTLQDTLALLLSEGIQVYATNITPTTTNRSIQCQTKDVILGR